MTDAGSLFMDAVTAQVNETLDACTRCGKCVEACPMVEPAGLDPANAIAIVEGILDPLAGGPARPRPHAGHGSAPTAANASRPAIMGQTRALWSTWRGLPV